MTESEDRDPEIAIHEAGHAVVANALRIGIVSLAFAKDDLGNSLARLVTTEPALAQLVAPITFRKRDYIERLVMVGLAGGLALGRVNANGLRVAFDTMSDEARVDERIAFLADDPSQTQLYKDRLRADTQAILDDQSWWRAVESLARRLVVSRSLSGRQVRSIIAVARAEEGEAVAT